MLSYCLDCASRNQSCCVNVHIFITSGDIERISQASDIHDFYSSEPLTPEYFDGGGDPDWNNLILDENGCRKIVRQTETGNCIFLSEKGCRLKPDIRPLLCRIYPYDFTGRKIVGISNYCPVSADNSWQEVLNLSQMHYHAAQEWIKQLYDEIYHEKVQPDNNKHVSTPNIHHTQNCKQNRRLLPK